MSTQGTQTGFESPRFVWHDLMTGDQAAAQAFYTQLLGWKMRGTADGKEAYIHIRNGESDIGGIVRLQAQHGVPPHWIGYVSVDDVDQTAKRVVQHGGALPVPPTDIPDVGRFAVVRDPQGAHVSLFKSSHGELAEPVGDAPNSSFCWDELLTTDPAKAATFYGEVFGWTIQTIEMGPTCTYYLFNRGTAHAAGGMMQLPKDAQAPPNWLAYIATKDVDAGAAKIRALGGKLCVEPQDIPGIARFCVATDPQGATFALYKRNAGK